MREKTDCFAAYIRSSPSQSKKKKKYTIKACITTNSKNLMSHPKLKSLSHPKLLYVFKPNDCDKNDFFYSHANETYYRKKDLHLALLGK